MMCQVFETPGETKTTHVAVVGEKAIPPKFLLLSLGSVARGLAVSDSPAIQGRRLPAVSGCRLDLDDACPARAAEYMLGSGHGIECTFQGVYQSIQVKYRP